MGAEVNIAVIISDQFYERGKWNRENAMGTSSIKEISFLPAYKLVELQNFLASLKPKSYSFL